MYIKELEGQLLFNWIDDVGFRTQLSYCVNMCKSTKYNILRILRGAEEAIPVQVKMIYLRRNIIINCRVWNFSYTLLVNLITN